jgi:hypothetical protein
MVGQKSDKPQTPEELTKRCDALTYQLGQLTFDIALKTAQSRNVEQALLGLAQKLEKQAPKLATVEEGESNEDTEDATALEANPTPQNA